MIRARATPRGGRRDEAAGLGVPNRVALAAVVHHSIK
jgi:hypothetical protein